MGIRKGYCQFIQWQLLRHACSGGCGQPLLWEATISCLVAGHEPVFNSGAHILKKRWSLKQDCPWNTMVKSVCSVMSNYATPWTAAHQCASVHGISQARILEWIDISSSRGSSWPRDRIQDSCIAGGLLTTESLGKPSNTHYKYTIFVIFVLFETDFEGDIGTKIYMPHLCFYWQQSNFIGKKTC